MRWAITRRAALSSAIAALLVVACATPPAPTRPPPSVTPPAAAAHETKPAAPVVREAAPIASSPPLASGPGAAGAAIAAQTFPSNVLYACVTETSGQRQQTWIEFIPKVLELCRKHPEMGPCQYERETCRRAGGRVFATDGREITAATEAEYDRKVLRARFRSN